MEFTQQQKSLLSDVTAARRVYLDASKEVEARVREGIMRELQQLSTAYDLAVRRAFNANVRKADILRASLTTNFNTMQEALNRTEGLQIDTPEPTNGKFRLTAEGLLIVTVDGVTVAFDPVERDDHAGDYMYFTDTPLWNNDMTERNEVVAALDGQINTDLWREANEFMRENA